MAIAWPPRPAPPRIRYVGQLRGAEDLKRQRGAFEAIGELLAGKNEPRPFYGPRAALLTDDQRSLWVADPGGRCLHLLDLRDRTYRRITRAAEELLLSPVDVCGGPPGSVYVCDSENVAIYQYEASSGSLLRSLRLSAELRRPAGVYYDAGASELYVADVAAHDIKVLDSDGRLLRILGRRGLAPGEFNYPCDLIAEGQAIWVVDTGNQRVQALTRTGEPITTFGQAGDAPGDLAFPKSVATDSDGHLYVVDARFENVQVFDRQGRLLLAFGEEGAGPGEFWLPAGIFIDQTDRIWVCDSYNSRIEVFDYLPVEADSSAVQTRPAVGGPAPASDR